LPASFSVNENVLARWVSGDNSFYPARITSITGAASKPVYFVSFKSYGTVETLTAKDIKPASNSDSRKRKADASSGPSSAHSPLPHPPNSSVISAAADINPALANQARKEPSKATDGPPRPPKASRKVKANKELEEGKMKWKDFASKGKLGKKDSMFRTGESPHARGMFPVRCRRLYTDLCSGIHRVRAADAQGPYPHSTYLPATGRRRLLVEDRLPVVLGSPAFSFISFIS
jgi:survival-of-motor-neuron-related-splicing factor 30